MFRPFPFFLGFRYTRAKKRNHFISFISLSSMIGIALGVMVLITVLSVMNGFDHQIRHRIFDVARQLTITQFESGMSDWENLIQQLQHEPYVAQIAPYISGQGLLKSEDTVKPVLVTGILPEAEKNMSQLGNKFIAGSLSDLRPQSYGIAIGATLASILGVKVGDSLVLLTSATNVTPAGVFPRQKRFKVVGIFEVGRGFGFDSGWAFIHLQDAQRLLQMGNDVTGLQFRLTDLYKAPLVMDRLAKQLSPDFMLTNWTRDYGSLFDAIAMEKTMMFLILLLIIAIAVFNLVSSLVMVVTDKQADIAILRTLGATPREILMIFMTQGTVIGIIGVLLGLISGVWLAQHVTGIVSWMQEHWHVQLFTSDAYYVNFLPSRLEWQDVWHTSVAAIVMSVLATIYPALRAAKVVPAEALRYE